ncbi:hypothetical protein [Micromonospora sp. NPDC051296]|uniref:hypothetical protein n=1 Tax=Micromonospora sp. NPDC051296 TaxID=3155046 RepID=UPI0034191637
MTNRPKMHTGGSAPMTAVERCVLRAVAVADAPCELWFLEQMVVRSGMAPGQPVDATVEELVARDVLVDTPAGLRLSSPQLRDGILGSVPLSLRRALHETAAMVLAVAGHSTQAASQMLQAMPVVSHAARVVVARLVTDPAVSPALAADLLLSDGAPHEPGARLDWLIATADNLFLAGRLTEALALLHDRWRPTGTGHASGLSCSAGWAPTTRPNAPLCPWPISTEHWYSTRTSPAEVGS